VCHRADVTWLRVGPRRALSIAAGDPGQGSPAAALPAGVRVADVPAFELAAIRDGEPMVVARTREHWVPQMLNLDLVGGVSFAKGCYTGQEIVTRTQHRGQIKRRMLRYAAPGAAPPAPGDAILTGSGKAGEVVRAAADASGTELLAVVTLEHTNSPLRLENGVALVPQPLPYALDTERSPRQLRS
jgi:folate-binding protein YgfZ